MKLKYRFFIIFSALAVVPMLLFFYIAYTHYVNLSSSQITTTSSKIMQQAAEESNSVFENMQHILEKVQFTSPNENTILQELRKYTSSDSYYSDLDIYETNSLMKDAFQNQLLSLDNINGIFIFTPSGIVLGQGYGNGVEVRSDYCPADASWYQNTLNLNGKIYVEGAQERSYLINDTPSISFSMSIYDVYSRDFLGVLYINCNPNIFSLDAINVLPDATSFVIKRNDEVLYQCGSFPEHTSENTTITYSQNLSCENVTLFTYFDKAGLAAEFQTTLSIMIAALIFFFILFIILAFLLARNLTRPISALSAIMSHPMDQKQLVESPYLDRTDEIGTLYSQYNRMLEENNRYIKSEYENKMVLMDTQMRALESQINAHFLYNTLEAINSLAKIEEVPEISTMALALGDMFRYSIKTKGALVTLQQELTHVSNFVAIQQIRFDNLFLFKIDVPEEMMSCSIIKLTLQPLVENALYHGLLNCNAGSTIQLSARCYNHILTLSVTDDGIGMNPQKLTELKSSLTEKSSLQDLHPKENSSIGLKNINSRIQLYYGDEYGISIESQENIGTTVTVQIPEIKKS